MRTHWEHALVSAFALGSLLSSCSQADQVPAVQDQSRSPAEARSPSTAEASGEVAFRKGAQDFGEARVFGVAIADVDADGDEDLFVGNYIGPSRLWLNNGDGVFSDSRQRFESSDQQRVHDVALADLNGDSCPDVFLLCHDSPSRVFFGDGAGGFTDSQQAIGLASDSPPSVVLGDADCDGDVDAFIIHSRRPNRLWVNDGTGHFARSVAEYGGSTSHMMTVADFNGDGFADLFLGFLEQPGEVWLNDGSGNFSYTRQAVGDEGGCDGMDSGDIDGDGDIDLVVANIEHGVMVWLNQDGAGTLAEAGPYFCPGTFRPQLMDADGDGDLDMITANMQEGNRLWVNTGSATFTPSDQLLGTVWAFCFAVGRLDSDEHFDVVIGNELDGLGACTVYFGE